MKFLGALHSLRHNDESHLERRAFLCTHFSLITRRALYWVKLRCWRPSSHLGDGLQCSLNLPAGEGWLSEACFIEMEETLSQFSVGGWVGASNSKDPSFLSQEIEFTWEESCICDLRERMCVALISVLYYWKNWCWYWKI